MKKIDYILGLPITENSISDEFLDFINADEKQVLISVGSFFFNGVDYNCSKVGFNMLMNSNYKIYNDEDGKIFIPPITKKAFVQLNVMGLFNRASQSGNNSVNRIVEEITNTIQTINVDCKIGLVCQGSPYVYDTICSSLMELDKDIKIIDTKSSIDLVKEKFNVDKNVNVHYLQSEEMLDENAFNVIGCAGEYFKILKIPHIAERIKNFTEIYQVHVGFPNDEIIRKLGKEQLLFELKQNSGFFDTSTLVVFNK